MKKFFILTTLIAYAFVLHAQSEPSICAAINNQMELHPMSQLRDIYKSCFQDVYGPGHIISDTAQAGIYLRTELAQMNDSAHSKPNTVKDYYEPVGIHGNFYRVNLFIIKNHVIPYKVFFNAFIRSTNGVKQIPVNKWAEEWALIQAEVKKIEPNMPNFHSDSVAIAHLLQQGHYAFDHSQVFRDTYNPHYRIISKKIFKKEILPYIKSLHRL